MEAGVGLLMILVRIEMIWERRDDGIGFGASAIGSICISQSSIPFVVDSGVLPVVLTIESEFEGLLLELNSIFFCSTN